MLTIFVVYAFLNSWRSTLITALSLPLFQLILFGFIDQTVRHTVFNDYIYEPANVREHPLPAGANAADYDAVLLPGGAMNADTLRMSEEARRFVREADRARHQRAEPFLHVRRHRPHHCPAHR